MESSNLPEQVLRQAREVEALEKAMNPETPPETQPPANPENTPPQEPQASQVQPAPAPQPPAPSEEETWKARYLSLQGLFNAEVPKLQNRVRELEAQVVATQAQPKPPAPEATPPKKLVTDKDVETYGGDLIDLIRRQASEIAQAERAGLEAEITKLRGENNQLQQQLGGVAQQQTQTSRAAYEADLTKAVADWGQININPEFHQWLAVPDPLSGIQRQKLLENAYGGFDVKRTAALFNAFKAEKGMLTAQPPVARTPPSELSRQIAPGTSRSAPSSSEPTGSERVFSQEEIHRFYTDVAKGLYAGKAQEAAKIEAEIDAAVAAGRVRM